MAKCKTCKEALNRAKVVGAVKICVECSKVAGHHVWHHCGENTPTSSGVFGWHTGVKCIQSSCPQSRWYKQADVASFSCVGLETGHVMAGEELAKFVARIDKARARHLTPKQREASEQSLKAEKSRVKYLQHLRATTGTSEAYYTGLIEKTKKVVANLEDLLGS